MTPAQRKALMSTTVMYDEDDRSNLLQITETEIFCFCGEFRRDNETWLAKLHNMWNVVA